MASSLLESYKQLANNWNGLAKNRMLLRTRALISVSDIIALFSTILKQKGANEETNLDYADGRRRKSSR
jgi:hypothetical protein